MFNAIRNWLEKRHLKQLARRAASITADPYQRSLVNMIMLIAAESNIDPAKLFEASIGSSKIVSEYMGKINSFSKVELMHLMNKFENSEELAKTMEEIINKHKKI